MSAPADAIPAGLISDDVRRALAEDIGDGDRSAALIAAGRRTSAIVICREDAVICGCAWFDEVFRQLDPTVTVAWTIGDGERAAAGAVLCRLDGPARPLLTGERTALNFLQILSGTATRAARYADAVRGTGVRILDTRKTLPGLRRAQKYAVRCGGCANHRIGLYDGVLIKENHIRAAGSITAALRQAQAVTPAGMLIEIEVEDLDGVREAVDAGATRLLLDNFSLEELERAVVFTAGRAELEASGNIDLSTVRRAAETGVDYISTGDITKNPHAIDLSMQFAV